MIALRAANRAAYNRIVAWVNQGREPFVRGWNSLPQSVKTFFGGILVGVSGNMIYDALLWVLGLD